MHSNPAINLGCVDCHGGDANIRFSKEAPLDPILMLPLMEKAHVLPRFPDSWHWPSSAKKDDLLIRQLEVPWQSRALVLLDHRSGVYSHPDAFEHAVRGAASAVRHLYRAGFSPALWTLDAGPVTGTRDLYGAAMERLATVQLVRGVDLHSIVVRMRRRATGGGALVMVTGTPDEQDLAAFRALTRDFNKTIILAVDQGADAASAQFHRAGTVTVVAPPDTPWAPVWREAMEMTWSTVTAG